MNVLKDNSHFLEDLVLPDSIEAGWSEVEKAWQDLMLVIKKLGSLLKQAKGKGITKVTVFNEDESKFKFEPLLRLNQRFAITDDSKLRQLLSGVGGNPARRKELVTVLVGLYGGILEKEFEINEVLFQESRDKLLAIREVQQHTNARVNKFLGIIHKLEREPDPLKNPKFDKAQLEYRELTDPAASTGDKEKELADALAKGIEYFRKNYKKEKLAEFEQKLKKTLLVG